MQSQLHNAFGEVTSDAGEGARTGYIGREHDVESDLGFYGVRLYEPEYGRFMSTDPLWGMYITLQPYRYALNMPTSLMDRGGDVVEAADKFSEYAIKESVPLTHQEYVKFVDGKLDASLLRESLEKAGASENVSDLLYLADAEETVVFQKTTAFEYVDEEGTSHEGRLRHAAGNGVQDGVPQKMAFGMTLVPRPERIPSDIEPSAKMFSPDRNIRVLLSPAITTHSSKPRGSITAHEYAAHVVFYLQFRKNSSQYGWWHKLPRVEKRAAEAEKEAGNKKQ